MDVVGSLAVVGTHSIPSPSNAWKFAAARQVMEGELAASSVDPKPQRGQDEAASEVAQTRSPSSALYRFVLGGGFPY